VGAHDAEFRAGLDRKTRRCAARAGDPIAPVTEEDETALHHPTQKVTHLDQLAYRCGLLADLERLRLHRVEVIGRLEDLEQHRRHGAANLVSHRV
jgi:hypothetical protein